MMFFHTCRLMFTSPALVLKCRNIIYVRHCLACVSHMCTTGCPLSPCCLIQLHLWSSTGLSSVSVVVVHSFQLLAINCCIRWKKNISKWRSKWKFVSMCTNQSILGPVRKLFWECNGYFNTVKPKHTNSHGHYLLAHVRSPRCGPLSTVLE